MRHGLEEKVERICGERLGGGRGDGGGRLASGGDHGLHLGLAAEEEADVGAAEGGGVAAHGLARVLVRVEGDEGVAARPAHDVHAAVRDQQALEEAADVEGARLQRQVLQPDDYWARQLGAWLWAFSGRFFFFLGRVCLLSGRSLMNC